MEFIAINKVNTYELFNKIYNKKRNIDSRGIVKSSLIKSYVAILRGIPCMCWKGLKAEDFILIISANPRSQSKEEHRNAARSKRVDFAFEFRRHQEIE